MCCCSVTVIGGGAKLLVKWYPEGKKKKKQSLRSGQPVSLGNMLCQHYNNEVVHDPGKISAEIHSVKLGPSADNVQLIAFHLRCKCPCMPELSATYCITDVCMLQLKPAEMEEGDLGLQL